MSITITTKREDLPRVTTLGMECDGCMAFQIMIKIIAKGNRYAIARTMRLCDGCRRELLIELNRKEEG